MWSFCHQKLWTDSMLKKSVALLTPQTVARYVIPGKLKFSMLIYQFLNPVNDNVEIKNFYQKYFCMISSAYTDFCKIYYIRT